MDGWQYYALRRGEYVAVPEREWREWRMSVPFRPALPVTERFWRLDDAYYLSLWAAADGYYRVKTPDHLPDLPYELWATLERMRSVRGRSVAVPLWHAPRIRRVATAEAARAVHVSLTQDIELAAHVAKLQGYLAAIPLRAVLADWHAVFVDFPEDYEPHLLARAGAPLKAKTTKTTTRTAKAQHKTVAGGGWWSE